MQKTHAKPVRSAESEAFPVVGGLTITKVVREHVPLSRPRSGFGETFGQAVDAALAMAAQNGEEVQSFEVQIDEGFWAEYAETLR